MLLLYMLHIHVHLNTFYHVCMTRRRRDFLSVSFVWRAMNPLIIFLLVIQKLKGCGIYLPTSMVSDLVVLTRRLSLSSPKQSFGYGEKIGKFSRAFMLRLLQLETTGSTLFSFCFKDNIFLDREDHRERPWKPYKYFVQYFCVICHG